MISSYFIPVSLISLLSARIYESKEGREENILDRCDTTLSCYCWSVGRSFCLIFSLVFFYASTYTRSYTLYCARWFGSKGKKRRQNENACQAKNDRESASERMMCRGHSHTRMYYKKTHLLLYSFVFLPFSCLLLFFGTFLPSFSRSLVLLLVVVLIVIRRY